MASIYTDKVRGLYAICDNSLCPDRPMVELAEQLLLGGAPTLQLRIKGRDLESKARRRRAAEQILALKRRFAFNFIINDDPQLVRDLGADGVHVGADDSPVDHCRRLLGPRKLIGYSSHSLAEAYAAEQAGANYVAFGAIFPTATKGPDHPVQGLDKLKELARTLSVPVVAIGGITLENAAELIEAGASAIAMISALTLAPNVVTATRQMRAALPIF